MTSKLSQSAQFGEALECFPDFPPRDDMQNFLHLYRVGHASMLPRHFGNPDTTVIGGEVPIAWRPDRGQGVRIPDLLIAFNVSFATLIDRNGYSIDEQGKPPDFVLEVASKSTGFINYTHKRNDYAAFGIPEYWRFDPTSGLFHDAPLAGDRLVDSVYQPIEIVQADEQHYWGRSDILNLSLCWENGLLRWWDPAAGQYLETPDEEAEARTVAEASAAEEQARADSEQVRADREQARAGSEQARAEREQVRGDREQARAEEAEARVRELEERLRRRQES
jgi:Uma2 family endonuclease